MTTETERCTCSLTDPKTWTTYGSAVEPGSQMEPDPDCPVHFPSDDEKFCGRCAAGVDSNEHHEKCVVTGHAIDGGDAGPSYRCCDHCLEDVVHAVDPDRERAAGIRQTAN